MDARDEKYSGTALGLAALNGRIDVLEFLLQRSPPPNISVRDRVGDSALHWAALNGFPGAVALLIAHGADPTWRNYDGDCPLEMAGRGVGVTAANAEVRLLPNLFVQCRPFQAPIRQLPRPSESWHCVSQAPRRVARASPPAWPQRTLPCVTCRRRSHSSCPSAGRPRGPPPRRPEGAPPPRPVRPPALLRPRGLPHYRRLNRQPAPPPHPRRRQRLARRARPAQRPPASTHPHLTPARAPPLTS